MTQHPPVHHPKQSQTHGNWDEPKHSREYSCSVTHLQLTIQIKSNIMNNSQRNSCPRFIQTKGPQFIQASTWFWPEQTLVWCSSSSWCYLHNEIRSRLEHQRSETQRKQKTVTVLILMLFCLYYFHEEEQGYILLCEWTLWPNPVTQHPRGNPFIGNQFWLSWGWTPAELPRFHVGD